ncbi:MAG: hypothetical protein OMM_05468 [Candidatus Magnetoglobus multicellularis str. Araruama]|uniref:Type IV secretion system coupling protein TraD DNA-binding domain-containing protein n=1 Tax=Candidatus Magnetoglobus multicellularis str. Araruama TaxID=890399 RepID=A0A1V1NW90_9BACT|nr:MAG: hypothetical protein OMM_05468 [Candidatus Magnetoglobus multicellularis str. Araruama]
MEKYKTLKRSYEGFDTLIDPVKKSIHLQVRVFVVLFIIHFMAFCCLTYLFFDAYTIRASIQWLLCKVLCEFFPLTPMSYMASDGNTIIFTAQQIYENPQMEQFAKYYLYQILIVYVFCCAIYTLYPFLLMWLRNRAQNLSNKQHVSGANLVTAKQYKKMLNKKKDQTNIPCGKVKMPVSSEPKHCLMLGVNDSARKIFIAQLIAHLKKNNEKAIIYDSGGTFSKQFYQQDTDFIFNPVDKNTLGWSLVNEISEKDAEMDMDAITSCLLAELRSDNKEAVKSVFAGIFAACIHRKRMANTDIYQLVSSDFPSISNALKGIETAKKGYRHIAEPSDRYAKGIFASVTQYSKCFEFMTYNDGPFSMKQWLHQPGGIIFVTTDLNAHDKLSPVLTLFLDLICQRLLSLDQPLSHPAYYIFDDFVSLKKKIICSACYWLLDQKVGGFFLDVRILIRLILFMAEKCVN